LNESEWFVFYHFTDTVNFLGTVLKGTGSQTRYLVQPHMPISGQKLAFHNIIWWKKIEVGITFLECAIN